jgi:hypothetical protein
MDLKSKKYKEQGGLCGDPKCLEPLPAASLCQLAHILPQRGWIKEKYGEDIVHHELNMKLTHPCDNCNSGVQMSPNKTRLVEIHVEAIRQAIVEELGG